MSSRDKLPQNVVRIQQGSAVGTGFFINRDGSLLTCFHVIREKETGKVTDREITVTFNDVEYLADCIFPSPDPQRLDMAILRLKDGHLPHEANLLPLGEWQPGAKQTHEFRTYGFRSEHFEGLHANGEIRGFTSTKSGRQLLQLGSEAIGAEEIRQGMSGGPVYCDAVEQIVGMLSLRVKEPGETIPCAIPLGEIAAIWPPIKERLLEEELLKQLPKVLRDKYFTEESFRLFYESLPLPDRRKYDELGENKFQALIEQLRNSGEVYDFINYMRGKHPNIPLHKLIELPPVHRINFVNREDELGDACGQFAPPYILFEAPAGYGKTELLKAIEQRHFRDGWLCIFVEVPKDVISAVDLINQLIGKAGYSENLSQLPDTKAMGYTFAGFLEKQLALSDAAGIVLLVDSVERLPEDEIDPFLNDFLFAIWSVIRTLRIRLAGRYSGFLWQKRAKEFDLTIKSLTPFRFRYVKETVRRLLPTQEEPDLCAAHLMHITGGHPGCMAEIIQRIDSSQTAEENFRINQDNYREIVLSVANETRKSIPEKLREIFDILSVFRRYNHRLLQQIIDAGLIKYDGDAAILERALTATYLVTRKDGFIQDEIVRRLLVTKLRWEEPERFVELCEKAKQVYEQDLQTVTSRPEHIAMEGLYHELQLDYYQRDQSQTTRETLQDTFYAESGALRRYLKTLSAKPYASDIKADLKTLLQDENRSWEFRFAVNFFLRGEQYDNEPYKGLLRYIDDFLDQEE